VLATCCSEHEGWHERRTEETQDDWYLFGSFKLWDATGDCGVKDTMWKNSGILLPLNTRTGTEEPAMISFNEAREQGHWHRDLPLLNHESMMSITIELPATLRGFVFVGHVECGI
jgi:hypothetical protein